MRNEFIDVLMDRMSSLVDLLAGKTAVEIAGLILAVVSVAVAAYAEWKIIHLMRRDSSLAGKFKFETRPWLAEAEQTYLKQKYGTDDTRGERPYRP